MNERARKLLDDRFGIWVFVRDRVWQRGTAAVRCRSRWLGEAGGNSAGFYTRDEAFEWVNAELLRSIIDPVLNVNHGRWIEIEQYSKRSKAALVCPDGHQFYWLARRDNVTGYEETRDAAKLAADFALYCEIVDAEKPAKTIATAGRVLFNDGFEIRDFVESYNQWVNAQDGRVRPEHSAHCRSVAEPRIPASFRAKLADEWELRPDGKHVRKATWEGMEFMAIEIVRSQKDGKIATLRCPGQASRSTVIVPCGWSKKDRRYLSQLWALWSEHHQEVPGADWREVAKARLGVK